MITFKQYLNEEPSKIHAKKFEDLPSFSAGNAEDNYRIHGIDFSAKDGLGAVPFNQSAYYHGL